MSKPDRLSIGMYTWSSLTQASSLSSLLRAFESQDDLKPTHWSFDDPGSSKSSRYQPYDRDSFLTAVSSLREHQDLPELYRREDPQYVVYLVKTHLKFNRIGIKFEKKLQDNDISKIYAWAGALVSSIGAEVAFIEPAWDDIDYDYEYIASTKAKDLLTCGLDSIAARTWFGSHLVKLIGQDLLHNCGGYAQDIKSGGVLLDLVENPWQTDAQTLTDAQKKVKGNLESTGIFGDYARVPLVKPGANWSPFPQPAQSSSVSP
jgi:hypothetical protein